MKRRFWIRADWSASWEELEPYVNAALGKGCELVLCRPEHAEKLRGKAELACKKPVGNWVVLEAGTPEEVERAREEAGKYRGEGRKVALELEISGREMEEEATKAVDDFDCLIVRTRDWKIIPWENLIAKTAGKIPLVAEVRDAQEAKVAIETLERGVDGVLLNPSGRDVAEVEKTGAVLEKVKEKLQLKPAKVTQVKQVGMGDRACVDTVTLMEQGEGMLVGSQAEGLFLVHSETLSSPFVEPRPFRVNAGAIHSYILVPGGKTKYLSELSSGDEVLIVNTEGESRAAAVGRVKIERRPLVMVEAECEGRRYRVMLQNAETINLVSKEGKPISVAKVKPGDELLIYTERGGRHFGVKVEETIIEK